MTYNGTLTVALNTLSSEELVYIKDLATLRYSERDIVKEKYSKVPGTIVKNNAIKYYKIINKHISVPIGLKSTLLAKGIKVHCNSIYVSGNTITHGDSTGTLYTYQEMAVSAALKSDRGLLVLPPGSGKTVIGTSLIAKLNVPTVIVCNATNLLHQFRHTISTWYPTLDAQVYKDRRSLRCDILLVTVQRLIADPELLQEINRAFDCIIYDEAHHIPAELFFTVATKLGMKYTYGLTATPDRKDGKSQLLTFAIGPILYSRDIKTATKNSEVIVPAVIPLRLDSVVARSNTYSSILNEAINAEDTVKAVIDTIKTSEAKYHLVVVNNIKQLYTYKKLLEKAGITGVVAVHSYVAQYKVVKEKRLSSAAIKEANYRIENYEVTHISDTSFKVKLYDDDVHAEIKNTARNQQAIINRCKSLDFKVLLSVKIAIEGLDIQFLDALHLVKSFKGYDKIVGTYSAELTQLIGRISRITAGKTKAFVYDYVYYNISMLKRQYYSRRKLYKKLGLPILAAKHVSKLEEDKTLDNLLW